MTTELAPGTTHAQGQIHHVRQGDCIASIAFDNGFHPAMIWEYAGNRELRNERKNPNALLPGDVVAIPVLQPKWLEGATDCGHRLFERVCRKNSGSF